MMNRDANPEDFPNLVPELAGIVGKALGKGSGGKK